MITEHNRCELPGKQTRVFSRKYATVRIGFFDGSVTPQTIACIPSGERLHKSSRKMLRSADTFLHYAID